MLQDKAVEKTLKDLKTELKKLQRLREQTRAFLAAPETDSKYTAVLQKARRDVELKMEAFKVVEKQHKIKAFSAAGLAQAKLDPEARAKFECEEWLSDLVDQANKILETYEGELEGISTKGGSKKKKSDRQVEIESWMEIISNHVVRLEQVLRALDNDQVSVQELEDLGLKDSLEYMLQSHMEPDFMDDDSIYDEIDLTEVAQTGKIADHTAPKPKAKAAAAEESPKKAETAKQMEPAKKEKKKKAKDKDLGKEVFPVADAPASASSARTPSKVPGGLSTLWKAADEGSSSSVGGSVGQAVTAQGDRMHRLRPTGQAAGQPGGLGYLRVATSGGTPQNLSEVELRELQRGGDTLELAHPSSQGSSGPGRHAGELALEAAARALSGSGGGGKGGKGRADRGSGLTALEEAALHAVWAGGLQFLPASELDRFYPHQGGSPKAAQGSAAGSSGFLGKGGFSRLAIGSMPASYPKKRLENLSSPSSFAQPRAELETLMFFFYYAQGTVPQLLAAHQLRKQGWQFHTKFNTWFKRLAAPATATKDSETGKFAYFDFHVHDGPPSWVVRVKEDFTFEYRFLEPETGAAEDGGPLPSASEA